MNILLLKADDFISSNIARLKHDDRRRNHLLHVLDIKKGATIKVGLLDGDMGNGVITAVESAHIDMHITLDTLPPPPQAVSLILALPRPKALRRILRSCTEIGIKEIHLINSWRVEKSFWQSPYLQADNISEQLLLGLEQAKDTLMPQLHLAHRFRPFVEDTLPDLLRERAGFVLHPYAKQKKPAIDSTNQAANPHRVICIGPEGGFIPYEVQKLQEAGCEIVSLGPRILRVETCVTWALATFCT